MKFITVNEPHIASITSYDNILMGFNVRGFSGLHFLKHKNETSHVALEIIGEGIERYNLPENLAPASFFEVNGTKIEL